MTYDEIRAVIALAVIHWIAWSSWAKADYFRKREKWDWERIRSMSPSAIITLMSIWAIDYPYPDNWGPRITIDIFAVSLIIFLRWIYFPWKYGKENPFKKLKTKIIWKRKEELKNPCMARVLLFYILVNFSFFNTLLTYSTTW